MFAIYQQIQRQDGDINESFGQRNSICFLRKDGFAMVMALAMVSIIGLSTAAMFNILGPQTKSTVRDVSKLKSGFEAAWPLKSL